MQSEILFRSIRRLHGFAVRIVCCIIIREPSEKYCATLNLVFPAEILDWWTWYNWFFESEGLFNCNDRSAIDLPTIINYEIEIQFVVLLEKLFNLKAENPFLWALHLSVLRLIFITFAIIMVLELSQEQLRPPCLDELLLQCGHCIQQENSMRVCIVRFKDCIGN